MHFWKVCSFLWFLWKRIGTCVCASLELLVVEKEALWGLGRWGVTDLKTVLV